MALGLALGAAGPRPGRRARRGEGRLGQPADRARPAADDVPGAGQGPLRRTRPGHRRPAAADLSSLVLNWVVGPALMFALAWLLLPDLPAYRTGLIIVGLARCIAMVLIWNDLACGDREAAAVLVALNSVFQIVAFAALGWFYLQVLPGWLGLSTDVGASSRLATIVDVGAGLPRHPAARRLPDPHARRAARAAATGTRTGSCPASAPVALYGLLFTIVILFALQGDAITSRPLGRRPHRAAAAGLLRAHVRRLVRSSGVGCGWATRRPRRWRSPPRATTSSSPSPWPSAPSASPAGRRWPASSGR